MAQFILGNSFKDRLNQWPVVRNSIWILESLILGGMLRLLSWLPLDTTSALGNRLGKFLGPRLPKHRSIVKNLRLAFPQKSPQEIEALALEVWGNAGSVLTEYSSMTRICKDDRIKVVIKGHIEGFKQTQRPIILVGAHLSNWEVLGTALTRQISPVTAPFSPPANPWLARKLKAYREVHGIHLLSAFQSKRALVEQLENGSSLAFLIDQRVDTGKPIPFMGKDKLTTVIPARLALKHGYEIVPARVERQQGANFIVTFYPPVTPDDSGADELEQAINVTTKINQLFADWIQENPHEWFCSNRMWDKSLESSLTPNKAPL